MAAGFVVTAALVATTPSEARAEGATCVGDSCSATYLAVTTTGDANSSQGVAVSATGNSYGSIAGVSALGYADGGIASASGRLTWVTTPAEGPVGAGLGIGAITETVQLALAGLQGFVGEQMAQLARTDPLDYLNPTVFHGEGWGCPANTACNNVHLWDADVIRYDKWADACCAEPYTHLFRGETVWSYIVPNDDNVTPNNYLDFWHLWTQIVSENAGICGIKHQVQVDGQDGSPFIWAMDPSGTDDVNPGETTTVGVGYNAGGVNLSISQSYQTYKGRLDGYKNASRAIQSWTHRGGDCPWWDRNDNNPPRPIVDFKSGAVWNWDRSMYRGVHVTIGITITYDMYRCCT